jgi:uncharacterized coiled-coil protein SlyX
MQHIINGRSVNLREQSVEQLNRLIDEGADRLDRLQDEMDSLHGELIRRRNNVIPLRPEYEGPSVA